MPYKSPQSTYSRLTETRYYAALVYVNRVLRLDLAAFVPVREIVLEAAECSDNGYLEVNWNIAVHSRVLDMALKSQGCQSRLVNSMCR
jgi:hypothetical protein